MKSESVFAQKAEYPNGVPAFSPGVAEGCGVLPWENRPHNTSPIPVLKLHGSINWGRSAKDANSLKVFDSYDDLRNVKAIPELVPPTWEKIFEKELESVWAQAITSLKTATRVIVIGFSMPPTDMHFKYLIAAGLRENLSLPQIVFVNPDQGKAIESRARKLLRNSYIESERITFVKKHLSEFAVRLQSLDGEIGLNMLGRDIEHGLSYELYNP